MSVDLCSQLAYKNTQWSLLSNQIHLFALIFHHSFGNRIWDKGMLDNVKLLLLMFWGRNNDKFSPITHLLPIFLLNEKLIFEISENSSFK